MQITLLGLEGRIPIAGRAGYHVLPRVWRISWCLGCVVDGGCTEQACSKLDLMCDATSRRGQNKAATAYRI